jgi:hypothetical protein
MLSNDDSDGEAETLSFVAGDHILPNPNGAGGRPTLIGRALRQSAETLSRPAARVDHLAANSSSITRENKNVEKRQLGFPK